NPGNACDPQSQGCFGSVSYAYQVGTYEVTNAQYAEFLNAKAASDPLGLYNPDMGDPQGYGGITPTGTSGTYTYSPAARRADQAGGRRVVLRCAALCELDEQWEGKRRHRDRRLHLVGRDAHA